MLDFSKMKVELIDFNVEIYVPEYRDESTNPYQMGVGYGIKIPKATAAALYMALRLCALSNGMKEEI